MEKSRVTPHLAIDLATKGMLVPEEDMVAIVRGCRRGLERLGGLAKYVTRIRAAYSGPVQTFQLVVAYQGPVGEEFATDAGLAVLRFSEHGKEFSSEGISRWFKCDVASHMKENLGRCLSDIDHAQSHLQKALWAP